MFCKLPSRVGKPCSGRWRLPALASNRQVQQVSPRTTISVLGPRHPSVSGCPRWNCYVRLNHKTTLPRGTQLQSRHSLSWSVILTVTCVFWLESFKEAKLLRHILYWDNYNVLYPGISLWICHSSTQKDNCGQKPASTIS